MIVICLEGCHGSGKTELCNQFSKAGFNVLDENFLDMPSFPSLHPQSLVMETIWVTNWIQRLLRIQQKLVGRPASTKETIFVVDRSPYSATFYAQSNGHLLQPLIQQSIADLSRADIHIISVYIKVDKEILWDRIQDRLLREPGRKKYNEDSREWMETTVKFYESCSHLWNLTVDNNTTTLLELMYDLLGRVQKSYPTMPYLGGAAVVPPVAAVVATGL